MRISRLGRFSVCLLFLSLATVAVAAPPDVNYHQIKKIPFGAAPGGKEYFDYILADADARRVYVTHGAEILVLNADTFELEGKISGLQKCHGVALAKDLGKGFITDGDASEVVVFDIASLKPTGTKIKTQEDTDSIIYDPASKHILTFNGDSKNGSVIDPKTEKVIKTIEFGGAPSHYGC